MIVVIDNYDSFVHNLARYLREEGGETRLIRNDAAAATDILAMAPAAVVLSPGPKTPREAGLSLDLLRALPAATPMLGVCLGHQCLVEAFGGRTLRAERPLHGEASLVRHDGSGILAGIASPLAAGRYHSLISALGENDDLVPCAWSEESEVMAVRRLSGPWFGVQFHPESLLTPDGRQVIRNFLSFARRAR